MTKQEEIKRRRTFAIISHPDAGKTTLTEKLHGLLGLQEKQEVFFLLAIGVPDEQPVSEDISDPKDVKYYLDDNNQLHVPKLTVDTITRWL